MTERFVKSLYLFSLLLIVNAARAGDALDHAQYAIFMGDTGVIVLKFQIVVGGGSPQQFFQHYVDDLLKSLDTNSDGTVSVDEAKGKYLTPKDTMQAGLIPQTDSAQAEYSPDTSPADGKITRQEFLTYFKRMGLQPFLMVYLPRQMPAGDPRRPQQTDNGGEVPLFARLDLNNDGKLSSTELSGALQTLHKLDLDDDETISTAELSPVATGAVNVRRQRGVTPTASMSPLLGIGSEESLHKQARRLIEKYDSADRAKSGVEGATKRNQKLSAMELGLPAEEFARFDGDGDGQLDFDELRQLITAPTPTITITIDLDKNQPLVAESPNAESQSRIKMTPDGAANINLGTTLLTILHGSSIEFASTESLLKPQFQAADRDANGYLEKTEAEQAFLYGAAFDDLDADKNGKVFLDEAVAYFKVRTDAARSRTVLTTSEQGRTLFEILDTDRDQRLSYRELQNAANKLSLWDRDGDGLLAESEVPLQFRMTIGRGNLPQFGGNFVASRGINSGQNRGDQAAGPVWFRKMDKNRDGEVSRREFLGDISLFKRLDRNQDGSLDLAESVLNVD